MPLRYSKDDEKDPQEQQDTEGHAIRAGGREDEPEQQDEKDADAHAFRVRKDEDGDDAEGHLLKGR